MQTLSHESISQLIQRLAPDKFKRLTIDKSAPVKVHNYCYISASAQSVEYRTDGISFAMSQELLNLYMDSIGGDNPQDNGNSLPDKYIPFDPAILEQFKSAPRLSIGGMTHNAYKRFREIIDGGRYVENHQLTLRTTDGRIDMEQPPFAVKDECMVGPCLRCKGKATTERNDRNGVAYNESCEACDGQGRIATVTWVSALVREREAELTSCIDGEIEGLKIATVELHKGDNGNKKRMLTRFNGTDTVDYPDELRPYLDMMHDKLGEGNAIEDIYYRIIPCHVFVYRTVLSGEKLRGVVIDPEGDAQLILELDGNGSRLLDSVKDRIKGISRFFGGIGKTDSFKDKEDLARTARLLIAIAIADGNVSEEEKELLATSVHGIDQLGASQRQMLVDLIQSADSSFLTNDDFTFHSRENAEATLKLMAELASADGEVHEKERNIIERLQFKY